MGIDRKYYENIEIPTALSGILVKTAIRKRKATAKKFAGIAMTVAVPLAKGFY